MKKCILVAPVLCLTLLGCNKPSKTIYNIVCENSLFDINMTTYMDQNSQIVKASIKDTSDTNYLIYLVNEDGIVTNSEIINKGKEVIFADIKSDSKLCVSKAFDTSLVETGIQPKMINNLYPDYYNDNYSDKVENKMNELKENNVYTVDKPLLIYNAYGTDELSMYFYFESNEKTVIEYKIVTTNHHIFTRNVETDFNSGLAYTTEHEFTAHGMIAGEINYILVNSYSNEGLRDSHYITYQPKSLTEIDPQYKDVIIKKETPSAIVPANGLFALSRGCQRNDPYRFTHITMLDNNADVRSLIPMNDYFFNNIYVKQYNGEKCLVYAIDYHQLVYVNYLGQTKKVITLICPDSFNEGGKYSYFFMHHDFCFDGDGSIITLAGKCESSEIDDKQYTHPVGYGGYVIKYNINTDKITVPIYIDKSIFVNYKTYTQGQTIDPQQLGDWFHPNTVQYNKENGDEYIMLSSRESSSVVRVKLGDDWPSEETTSIENPPIVKWVLTNNTNVRTYESGLTFLEKEAGSNIFLPNLGQHSTYIIKENIFSQYTLKDNQYYLAMFSNNADFNHTSCVFDYTGVPESEMNLINNTSKNKVYIIDEKNNTYNCIYDKNVPYAPIMSNFVYYNSHWISQSSMNTQIIEKTLDGQDILKISFYSNNPDITSLMSYRTFKIDI